jgi:hypothetical protein
MAADASITGLKTAGAALKTVAEEAIKHPKVAFAATGTAASLYVGYHGCKDIWNIWAEVPVKQEKGSEEEDKLPELRKHTWKESAELLGTGSLKLAGAAMIAFGTYRTLVLASEAPEWIQQKQDQASNSVSDGYNWAATKVSAWNTQVSVLCNNAMGAFRVPTIG